ncbi:nucleotide-diphospho-sugar transferase [Dipodascopsis uninucleata]
MVAQSTLNSVIVPAYHEKPNIRPLTERLFAALEETGQVTELIFVDDNSRDGSVEEVDKLASEGYNVQIIVRTKERGLSSAVMHGFQSAKGTRLVCMDADLQHPPERVPALFQKLERHAFVLGTRYAEGVEMDKDWPLYRRVISSGARLLALPLTSASDPMSGFFGIQKKYIDEATDIDAHGFKIALELLVKTGAGNDVAEVPFSFGVRTVGESKLTGRVMLFYLDQLRQLYVHKFGLSACIMLVLILILIFFYCLYHIYYSFM